jgi:hypothetical protein
MDWDDFLAGSIPEPHTITVEAYEGAGAYGDTYAAAAEVPGCVVEHTRRRVQVQTQDAAGGIVISSTTVYAPPGTTAPAESRVTLPDGTVTRVLQASYQDAHGHDLPSHWELLLE